MRMYRFVLICISFLLLAAACTPAGGPEPAAGTSAPQGSTAEMVTTAVPPALATAVSTGTLALLPSPAAAGEHAVVDAPPLSEGELAAQPPAQSPPGAAEGSDTPPDLGATAADPALSGPLVPYTNEAYGFALDHPADFTLAAQPLMLPLTLDLPAAASFAFISPTTAGADAPEYEFADFEVRVYPLEPGESLEAWLAAGGGFLAGAGTGQPLQTASVSGVEICLDTMLFPNCTAFAAGAGWVYQLIPVTLEGYAMLASFRLLP